MPNFYQITPTLDNRWRAIILFGLNVASYKFALGKTLLEKAKSGATTLSLEELADPYSRYICEHLNLSDKQATSKGSKFLDACRGFNLGQLNREQLIQSTVRYGFQNVIDAFHVVNRDGVGVRFFTDERNHGGGVCLTDEIFQLKETLQGNSLEHEVEARWRLVETAWSLNLSRNLVMVHADDEGQTLFVPGARRVVITSSRPALNGYQKGFCFYCFDEISISPGDDRLGDVDHFFPWSLRRHGVFTDVDGVWNLVLACHNCNRGEGGKFQRVPSLRLLERLHHRNSYLIDSHHPLRETLIQQTGKTEDDRRSFLQNRFAEAKSKLIHEWEPKPQGSDLF